MVTTRQQYIQVFGTFQVFTLGTVLIIGACLAWPVQMIPLRPVNTPQADMALWIVETVLYLGFAAFFSRNINGTIAGFVLGFLLRLVASALMFLLVSIPLSKLFVIGGEQGLLHALATAIALLALTLSFRTLLANLGLVKIHTPVEPAGKTRIAFDNRSLPASKSRAGAKVPLVLPPEGAAADSATCLRPPDDLKPILAQESITGSVTVPASLILESVPEAKSILIPGYGIDIRLAYLVPQLSRGTAWLTWRQVFEKGVPPMPNVDTTRLEQDFIGRWIRLAPRNYITQVPSSYFSTAKSTPVWMKLPPIEQEAEIVFNM